MVTVGSWQENSIVSDFCECVIYYLKIIRLEVPECNTMVLNEKCLEQDHSSKTASKTL